MLQEHSQAPPAYETALYAKPTAPPPNPALGEPAVGTPLAFDASGSSGSGRDEKLDVEILVQNLIDQFDLDYETATDLCSLRGSELVVIADDSGSMGSRSTMRGEPTVKTRWHELQYVLRKMLDIFLFVDKDGGFELQFLNSNSRLPLSIRSRDDLEKCWSFAKPSGGTPLLSALRPYMTNERNCRRVIMVLTDGCPSDGTFDQLRGVLAGKANGVYVNVVMCTDEDEVVDRYEDSVDAVPNVDVHDDYHSEKEQVMRCGGKLSFNKYLAKCVLGAVFSKYDSLDDPRHGFSGDSCACSIM